MKPIKFIFIIFIILSGIFAIVSCGEQDGGLFYSLEHEIAIDNGTLSNDITIGSMEKNNGYYFIAAGSFMYLDINDVDDVNAEWVVNNPDIPENEDDYLCYNMTKIGNYLYCVFYSNDATSIKLFKMNTTKLTWSDAITFTNIPTGETVIDFSQSGDRLFVFTLDASIYSVYTAVLTGFTDSSTFTTIKSDLLTGGDLKSAHDGTSYWITAGNQILKYDEPSTVSNETGNVMAASNNLLGEGFSGVVCADTDTTAGTEVYLTSEEGVMLKYVDSDDDSDMEWTVLLSSYDTDNGLFEPLNDIAHIVISNDVEDIDIIIAASETGYYEMEAARDITEKTFVSAEKIDTKLITYNQFSSIDLSNAIILSFYFDNVSTKEKIFALGYRSGLWKNSLRGTAPSQYRFWDNQ